METLNQVVPTLHAGIILIEHVDDPSPHILNVEPLTPRHEAFKIYEILTPEEHELEHRQCFRAQKPP